MFQSLVPNLMVKDVKATVKFYEEVLGFKLKYSVPDGDPKDWAQVESGNISLMFQSVESLEEDIPYFKGQDIASSSSLYIDTKDVEDLHEKIKDKVEIVEPLRTTQYGMKEFYMKDPNGYILAFAERV